MQAIEAGICNDITKDQEPLLCLSRGRIGYLDDAAFFSQGRTFEEYQTNLQKQLDLSQDWARENGVLFDMQKTELIYFHKKRKFVEPPLYTGKIEIAAREVIEWLGEHFDRKLSFREHVRFACQRSPAVTYHVRRLCSTARGASPGLQLQAAQACALVTLFYMTENWYNPQTSQWALNQDQTAMNRVALAVLSDYKKFPIPLLLRETGWGPVNTWLDRIHDRLALRIAVSDPGHPLGHRSNSPHFT